MSVLDQAQNFAGGPVAAARQRDRWARKEANATDDELREQYREAVADLEARYPDVADVPIGGAEAFARERGHGTGARSPVHEGRRRAGSGGGAKARTSGKASGRTAPAGGKGKPAAKSRPGKASRPSRSSTSRPTPRVDRAIRQTGIPAAASSTGSTLLAALGATVGMGLLYLVITSAENVGSGSDRLLRLIEKDVPQVVGNFLSPEHDVFPSNQRANPGFSVQVQHVGPGGRQTAKPTTSRFRGQSTINTAAARLKLAQEQQEKAGAHPGR